MKKLLLLLAACLLAAGPVNALELVLRNGTILHKVHIVNMMENGVNVSCVRPGQGNTLQEIHYNQLTAGSRRILFDYFRRAQENLYPYLFTPDAVPVSSPAPAMMAGGGMNMGTSMTPPANFSLPVSQSPTPQTYAPVENLPPDAGSAQSDGIVLPGTPRSITLHSVAILTNGTLGWADSYAPFSGAEPTHFGLMYVYGVYMPQGNVWTGDVYPTNKTILHRGNFYPCYATSIPMARRIDASVQY